MKIVNRDGKKVKTLLNLEPYDIVVCEEGRFPISNITYSEGRVILTLITDESWRKWWR